MYKKFYIVIFFMALTFGCIHSRAQILTAKREFTRQDSLRGAYGTARSWWDVIRYDINVQVDIPRKFISGYTDITYKVLQVPKESRMQIDLQMPMEIERVEYIGRKIPVHFTREGNVYWLDSKLKHQPETENKLRIYFKGNPKVALRAPWDGGWVWAKDSLGRDWVTVACQGLGASVWYPCKDHQSDEPDKGASLRITVPDTLTAVGNGRLVSSFKNNNGTTTWHWEVKNTINTYNIIPYIGKYVHFSDTMYGKKGVLDLSYWVLDYNLPKAKKQFTVVPEMIQCFESWMGPYPFYEDSYKLVDAPHLGMEHQSNIAYGNKYLMGYLGKDLSGSGWGMKWDYIIIHESGHEWFGNNITSKDVADMWIHEGFTNYTEVMFLECKYGKKAGSEYAIGLRKNIANDIPIIGIYGVNKEGSSDMYFKASNMLHTIRQVIDDDALFKKILQGLGKDFYHSTVTTQQVENYIIKKSGKDLSKIFDQYLRTTMIPQLVLKKKGNTVFYKWENVVPHFNMPIKLKNGTWIYPTEKFKKISIGKAGNDAISVIPDFYITIKEI